MSTSNSSVVVVGSVAVDWIITPHAQREASIGGAATFFALAASYFAPVRMVGVVGGDFPKQGTRDLKARGVDVAGLSVVPDGKTFRWKGRYHDNMSDRDTLDTQLGVFETFDPKLPPAYRTSEYLFLANIVPDLQLKVLEQMERPKFTGLDSMNLWIDTTRDSLLKVIARVDMLTLNEEEAMQLSGEHNVVRAANAILRMGPTTLVIKRGPYGAMLFHEGTTFCVPALPVADVVDPTGAGDTFAGGMMGYLAQGLEPTLDNMRPAMVYGSVLASFNVEGFSYDAIAALDREQIQRRFDAFVELTRFPARTAGS